jgi:large subunit ribosomal protein L29
MALAKIKDIREQSTDELAARRSELRQERVNLRIQQQNGQLENPARFWQVRKELARIETVLTQRAQAQAEAAAK